MHENNRKKLHRLHKLEGRDIKNFDPYSSLFSIITDNEKKMVTGAEYPNLNNRYEEEVWKNIQSTANCYMYAFGYKNKDTHFAQPGHFGINDMNKYHFMDREFTCANYLTRILKDVPQAYPVCHTKKCKEGYYKVYFTVAPNRDYHFYKQVDDSKYAHKPGSTRARMTDSNNEQIINPILADRFNKPDEIDFMEPSLYYMTMCNSFCVPNTEKTRYPVHLD